MAAFASGRRSPGIRFFVVILALIMAFSCVALPVYALSESVALFGLAAVLSSATAALGFKLTNNQQGIDTINRMCADFIKSALAPALVVIGTRANGLQNDMAYIKMQVVNAKTYLDERVLAWVQQWLGQNGVYETGVNSNTPNLNKGDSGNTKDLTKLSLTEFWSVVDAYLLPNEIKNIKSFLSQKNIDLSQYKIYEFYVYCYNWKYRYNIYGLKSDSDYTCGLYWTDNKAITLKSSMSLLYSDSYPGTPYDTNLYTGVYYKSNGDSYRNILISNVGSYVGGNTTGLSGQDTIGEDYKDQTLEQILQGLKDHAPDWYDAGADSSTNSTVGAKDLPVTVPAGAATENPALNPDAVYNPPFDQPLDDTRSGATSSTAVADGVTNANTAESSEAAAATVTETQTIIDSLINWANNYISPDKGLFSKFPLCIPYDVYLLVSSALGVDARDISDIVNADTSDICSLSNDSTSVNPQSDFVPVVDIQHDFNLDGYTYPIRISFDLTPYEPLININRIFLSIALIAELIGSEYKRIRWGK